MKWLMPVPYKTQVGKGDYEGRKYSLQLKCKGGPKHKAHAYEVITNVKDLKGKPQCIQCLKDKNSSTKKAKPTLSKKQEELFDSI